MQFLRSNPFSLESHLSWGCYSDSGPQVCCWRYLVLTRTCWYNPVLSCPSLLHNTRICFYYFLYFCFGVLGLLGRLSTFIFWVFSRDFLINFLLDYFPREKNILILYHLTCIRYIYYIWPLATQRVSSFGWKDARESLAVECLCWYLGVSVT